MERDVISDANLEVFAEWGLIIFVVVFILIIIRAVFMKKDRVEHMEKLPLDDGQQPTTDEAPKDQEVHP